MKKMKIAVPTDSPGGLTGKRSDHFGHCDVFTLVEIEDGKVAGVDTLANIPHGAGGCMKPVGLLKDRGVNAIVVVGMGAGPLKGFAGAGIGVYLAALPQFENVVDAVQGFLEERLAPMQAAEACMGDGSCHH